MLNDIIASRIAAHDGLKRHRADMAVCLGVLRDRDPYELRTSDELEHDAHRLLAAGYLRWARCEFDELQSELGELAGDDVGEIRDGIQADIRSAVEIACCAVARPMIDMAGLN